MNTHRKTGLSLGFIGLIAFFARIIELNQSFWLDEAITANVIQSNSFIGIVKNFSPSDFHPPLYYLLIKGWAIIMGVSEVGLRSFSVICGIAAVFVIYQLGKKLFNINVGLIAALFLALSPVAVYYSQEARMYSLETLLTVTLVYLFWLALEQKTIGRWLLFWIAGMALLYTDYLPVLVLVPLAIWVLIYHTSLDRETVKSFRLAIVAIGASFLPFLPTFFHQLAIGKQATASAWGDILGRGTVKQVGLLFVKFLIGRISFDDNKMYLGYVVVPALPALVGIGKSLLTRQKNIVLIVLWFFVPLVIGLALTLKFAVFDYFRFLFILPAFILLVAYGLQTIRMSVIYYLLLSCFVLSNIWSLWLYYDTPRFHREDWRSTAFYIDALSTSQSAVVFPNAAQADGFHYYDKIGLPILSGTDQDFGLYDQVWLMRYVQDIYDPQDVIPQQLEAQGFEKQQERQFNQVSFWQYSKSADDYDQ